MAVPFPYVQGGNCANFVLKLTIEKREKENTFCNIQQKYNLEISRTYEQSFFCLLQVAFLFKYKSHRISLHCVSPPDDCMK